MFAGSSATRCRGWALGSALLATSCTLAFPIDDLSTGGGGTSSGSLTSTGASSPTNAVSVTSTGAGVPMTPYAMSVFADDPIAFFEFEDNTLTLCKNSVTGSPITCVPPSTGGSFGTGAVGQGVCFDDPAAMVSIIGSLDFPGDVPFTIEMWVRLDPSRQGGGGFMFDNMADPGGQQLARTGTWIGIRDGSDLPFSETWTDNIHYIYTEQQVPMPFGNWVQIVLEHSDRDYLYVNTQSGEGAILDPTLKRKATNVPTKLGGFHGCVDEFSAYATALDITRIGAHYAARSM